MAWGILIVAGLCEVGWALCLKWSEGFTRPWPTAGFIAAMIASVVLLGVSLKTLPLGTAYAVWTGIGAAGTVILGTILLGETADPRRLFCIGLILAGVAGLKWLSAH